MIGLYEIRNIINNKVYVGSSVDILTRLRNHKRLLRGNKHHSIKLQRAWNKYGENSFQFTILKEVERGALKKEEQKLLDDILCNRVTCYNMAIDAVAPMRGRTQSKAVRKRKSETLLRLYQNPDFKQRFIDIVSSEAVKKNMSEGGKKRWAESVNRVEQSERTRLFFSIPENRAKNSKRTSLFFADPEKRKVHSLNQPKKISDTDVQYIRKNYTELGTQQSIATRFNISVALVNNLIHNKRRTASL